MHESYPAYDIRIIRTALSGVVLSESPQSHQRDLEAILCI
jgi:hypothetical protein